MSPESTALTAGADSLAIIPSVPPNVSFYIDDLEDEWTFSLKFDFIYSRMLTASISDWPKFFRQSFEYVYPSRPCRRLSFAADAREQQPKPWRLDRGLGRPSATAKRRRHDTGGLRGREMGRLYASSRREARAAAGQHDVLQEADAGRGLYERDGETFEVADKLVAQGPQVQGIGYVTIIPV